MKRKIAAALIAISLFSLPAMGRAQTVTEDLDFCEMHGMMRGHGTGGMEGMDRGSAGFTAGPLSSLGRIKMLDINQEQRSKINKIQHDLRKQQWALQGKILDEQAKLSDLHSAERPDARKIGAVYGTLFDIRRQMIEAKIEAMNRAKDVLNKDQLNKLRNLENRGQAAGGMYGGMMHEMMESNGTMTPHP